MKFNTKYQMHNTLTIIKQNINEIYIFDIVNMNKNSKREPLKDFVNIIQQKSLFQIKNQNPTQKKIALTLQNNQNNNEQILFEKENRVDYSKKTLKLKLKSVSSREMQRKHEQNFYSMKQNNKTAKLKQVNSVLKASKNDSQITTSKDKKRKIDCYFKPNVINFSLKSLKQSQMDQIQQKQLKNQRKNLNQKERQNSKNYSLSGFISQIISKLLDVFPQISKEQITLKTLHSHYVGYSDLVTILHSISMIRYSSEIEYKVQYDEQKEQLQKVYLMWRILKTSNSSVTTKTIEKNYVSILNLIIFLAAIVNVKIRCIQELIEIIVQKSKNHHSTKKCSSKQIQSQQITHQPTQIFFIRNKRLTQQLPLINYEGQLIINLDEQMRSEVFKQFKLFRVNRLNAQNNMKARKNILEINLVEQFDIGSLMSPKSQQLALTKRIKIIQQLKTYSSEQNSLTKESKPQIQLNLFLNYKSDKKCSNQTKTKTISGMNNQKLKQKRIQQNNLITNPKRNIYIPSQKINFSQINAVKNMEKGRQLKQQKKMILQKGWTNNGSKIKSSSNQNSTQFATNTQRFKQCKLKIQSACIKQAKNYQMKSFFESRKNSFNGLNKYNTINGLKEHMSLNVQRQQYKNLPYLECDNLCQETIRQIQILERISNNSISIDDNESLDLDDEDFAQDQDFIVQNQLQLEKEDEETQQFQIEIKNNNIQNGQSRQKFNEQFTEELPTTCKTFNTEENQLPDESSSTLKQQLRTERPSKQNRVIKSYLKIPILYVDVNMDESKKERIIIYEEDNPNDLARQFGNKHGLDRNMIKRLEDMLNEQIGGILGRIDEEDDEYDETNQDAFKELSQKHFEYIKHQ